MINLGAVMHSPNTHSVRVFSPLTVHYYLSFRFTRRLNAELCQMPGMRPLSDYVGELQALRKHAQKAISNEAVQ